MAVKIVTVTDTEATVQQAASVYDPLADVNILTDVSAVEFVATQLNDASQNQNLAQGAPRMKNLTEIIVDIIVDTVAQGASTLEVHVSDPYWWLFTRPQGTTQPAFIDVDDAGLLIPVDVNFPENTDSWWRLAACQTTVDPTQAHVLTFEDRIVTLLRDQGGPKHAANNQTRAQFIYSCVRTVPEIRFVCPALNAPAGSVAGDVTQGNINTTGISGSDPVAASALNANAPKARKNPSKQPGIDRKTGAVSTPNGWRYTKPIDGLSVPELDVLNPPTNTVDGGGTDFGGGGTF